MKRLFRVIDAALSWWWLGMTLHARQVCRDEVEILERIRNRTGEKR